MRITESPQTRAGLSRRELLTISIGAASLLALNTQNEAFAKHHKNSDSQALPPAFHLGDTVLFQGDSITDGGRWRTGLDYNHIMGQDYCYIIAGEILSQYPSANLTFLNRGIGGNTLDDLANRWQPDTIDLKPNLLSILVGVNDANESYGRVSPGDAGAKFQETYDELVRQTLTALPSTRIVLCQPFLLPVGPMESDFENRLAQVAAMQTATEAVSFKYSLPLVRFGDMMDKACERAPADHWSWDGIHPTYAGHFLMHSVWLETVGTFYAKPV